MAPSKVAKRTNYTGNVRGHPCNGWLLYRDDLPVIAIQLATMAPGFAESGLLRKPNFFASVLNGQYDTKERRGRGESQ